MRQVPHRLARDRRVRRDHARDAGALERGGDQADLIGIDLAARAGYNPGAGVTLWQKMAEASKGAPPQFLSTHPSGPTRISDIQKNLPKVAPLYARAEKPAKRFEPPKAQATPKR